MGTLTAIYVRATDPVQAAALRVEYPTAYTEPGSEFYAFEGVDYTPPEAELAMLSARLGTDVLWLGFQSAVDAFQSHHWSFGKHLRTLVFGCFDQERTWDRAEGKPEEWEREAFFNSKSLGYAQRNRSNEATAELQRIWREAEIVPGRMDPSIDARESARKVAEFYRLPGWS
jgi:hypothetical protein